MRVLLACLNAARAKTLRRDLKGAGITVEAEADPNTVTAEVPADVLLLDLSSPWRDLAILQGWRRRGVTAPVLLLVDARHGQAARALGLELGADDCLTRPFARAELAARLRALTRNGCASERFILRRHDLEIDLARRRVIRAGRVVRLTPREFDLLHLLARNCGRVVSRSQIWHYLYDACDVATSNVIDVYIRYLRTKLDRGFDKPLILTRWGEGYLLRGEDKPAPQ